MSIIVSCDDDELGQQTPLETNYATAVVEAAIDGGAFMKVDLFHPFSRGLHYPRTVLFTTDLKPGKHTLKLRIAEQKNKESTGHAVRIVQFVTN